MNKVILSGNLCKDIEVKQSAGGKEVVTNTVAVQREFKNKNGEYESDFINIVVWGQSATYLGKYGHKGDRVEVVGRWEMRKYQDRNGATQYVNECIVESIKVFAKQKKEEPTYNPYEQPKFDDLPSDQDLPF